MDWNDFFKKVEKEKNYMDLQSFLNKEYNNKSILPNKENIFKAFELTPLNRIKVVIIGQDPYQTKDFANGLAFSVNDNIKIPKSLQNIYKEIHNELNIPIPTSGNLEGLAKKGVFLLNRILTVEEGKPLSHKNIGWEQFTNEVIKLLNEQEQSMVFLLFGKSAQSVIPLLNNPNHLVLCTTHPSPLSAYSGFFGSGVFKKTCDFLKIPYSFWEENDEKIM